MSDYGFSDIFSQKNIAIFFPFISTFFRVFQHLMLKINPPPFTFSYNIYSLFFCPTSQQHYGYLIKKQIAHFTFVAD